MEQRRRRRDFLSADMYGRKYEKKPKKITNRSESEVVRGLSRQDELLVQNRSGPDIEGENMLQSIYNSEASIHDKVAGPTINVITQHDDEVSDEITLEVNASYNREQSEDYLQNNLDGLLQDEEESILNSKVDSWSDFLKVFARKSNRQFKVNSDLLTVEILFMVLNYYVRHNLSQQALEDLLKMLNVVAGTKTFPENFATFASEFHSNPYDAERVYFCTCCQYDFGKSKPEKGLVCPICTSKERDFFVTIPVEPQLREMVLKYKNEIEQHSKHIEEGDICDINRGRIARGLMEQQPGMHLTLSANTDGAATCKSNVKKPLYPIFVTLNNLPPMLRFSKHNLMLAGLWLSKGEPNSNLLFKYFCLELRNLKDGVSIGNERYIVNLVQVCLDSVARCKVLCMKQYNGDYGCTMCLHPGKATETSTVRYYPCKQFPKRDDASTRAMMNEVHLTGKEMYGVLDKSVFVALPDFDIISSFPPDYMHFVLLGATKQIWASWTESENHRQPFYVGLCIKEIESRMLSFRPPSAFPRYPRSLDETKKFKANEWETMLLHYIYPCLYNILPKAYLDHIMLLSSIIFLMLGPKLTKATIDKCEKQLKRFGRQFEKIYGLGRMTYNVHLLSHLAEAVRNLGALYNSSLYPYEAGNGMLLKYCSGNNKPVLQIEKKYYLNKLCQFNEVPEDSAVKSWIKSAWSRIHPLLQYDHMLIFVMTDSMVIDDDITEQNFSQHSKMYYHGLNLCTKIACADYKYDDSWIWIKENFYNIENILCDKNNNGYIVGRKLKTVKLFANMYTYTFTNEFRIMKITQLIRQCINMHVKHKELDIRFISLCKVQTQID